MSLNHLLPLLQSPDDGTPIGEDLRSENGIQYSMTDSGILMLDREDSKRPLDIVYEHPMFKKWEAVIEDRIKYYTKKSTVAGRAANLSYRSIDHFNQRKKGEFLLDIGCGDGSELERLTDRSTYIGIDRNLKRLEILKANYPEATAIYADATKLPFRDNAIKYIYSSNCFEHLWYLKEVVLECYRIMPEDGEAKVVVPTEGGLWNLGRKLFSKPRFQKKYPEIDFETISHIEHCNEASQIKRTLETFFETSSTYLPSRIPSIYTNALLEVRCRHHRDPNKRFTL
ncbi:MAG: class I SAM-dependent methyltransferase [Bacteroidota bacterium]